MTSADIPAGMRLKEIAGWNQSAADWHRFLESSPHGCFVAEIHRQVCGTVTTMPFQDRFAWIGMVLVHPDYRGRGLGTRLLERAIEHLDELKLPTLKLDATPQGQPLYEKLGFQPEYEIGRWTRRQAPSIHPKPSAIVRHDGVERPSPELLGRICTADREMFGADRTVLLESLHRDAPDFTQAVVDAGLVTGYSFGRRGSFADHLGPWMAIDEGIARQLLRAFLSNSSRDVQIVDCVTAHPAASDLLRSAGFTYTRPLVRMYRGSNAHPGRPERLCAIVGPEFG
jgi:GNAT superfamily N-acetyltransferase